MLRFHKFEVQVQSSPALDPAVTPTHPARPKGTPCVPGPGLWAARPLSLSTRTVGVPAEVAAFPRHLAQVPLLFPWKQLSPKSPTPEIRKIRGPYYHKTILTRWGPLGGGRGGPELPGSPFQLQPLEMLRGTRNLVFISSECEEFCRSEWTFDSGWRWNLSRTR